LPIERASQVFIRSRSVVSRTVAGETLIVPVRGKVGDLASIYSFNGTGSLIWQLLDAPHGLADLVDAVAEHYDVAPEQAQKDVTQFLDDMLSVGLVAASYTDAHVGTTALGRPIERSTQPSSELADYEHAAWETAGSH
jgi:Coenzyme PQQ synthesis protein D (PqqD)